MMNIALIEDGGILTHTITYTLERDGFILTRFKGSDIDRSLHLLEKFQAVIINNSISILDLKDLLEKIKKTHNHIFIFGIITKGDWEEKLRLFEYGADEVLSFPFRAQELVVRLRNLLSRPREQLPKKYTVGDAIIDTNMRQVFLRDTVEPLILRKKEYGILEYLARNKQRPVSRNELLDNIWDYRKYVSSNTVDVHISNIRKKLGDHEVIKTVHGFGYQVEEEKRHDMPEKKQKSKRYEYYDPERKVKVE